MRKDDLSTVALILILILTAGLLMISCSKKAMQSNSEQTATSKSQETETTNINQEVAQNDAAAPETEKAEFVNQNIYFDFDSALLSDQAQQILTKKADYLRDNPGLRMTIEGYCDERGTEAYNMALGERRAKSAEAYLETMGVSADRLRTISYGEERPIVLQHDESSWAENRRAQFVIQ